LAVISRPERYLECFYQKGMTLTEIAKLYSVSVAAVRKAIIQHDPEAYQKEQQRRSEERKKARQEKDRISKQMARKRNRKPEYIEEDKEVEAWLDMHFKLVFPAKKKKGTSDAVLVWFGCAQSGIKNVLESPETTNDMKQAIRNAYRKQLVEIETIDQDHLNPIGCSKVGKGGGKSDRTQRMAMIMM